MRAPDVKHVGNRHRGRSCRIATCHTGMRVRTGRFEQLRSGESAQLELVSPFDREDGIEEYPAVAQPSSAVGRNLLCDSGSGPSSHQLPEDDLNRAGFAGGSNS